MKWSRCVQAWRSAQRGVCLLAVTAACCGAFPYQALAGQVQAYVIFEVGASSTESAVGEKLRGTSLGNCKQLIVGSHLRDVFVHIACDEPDRGDSYLDQALVRLSRIDGISRATIVSLKRGI